LRVDCQPFAEGLETTGAASEDEVNLADVEGQEATAAELTAWGRRGYYRGNYHGNYYPRHYYRGNYWGPRYYNRGYYPYRYYSYPRSYYYYPPPRVYYRTWW
jgi:hypothetical protein